MSYILIFLSTSYDNFEQSYLQKTILTFWPLVTLTLPQGHSTSNRQVLDYVQMFYKFQIRLDRYSFSNSVDRQTDRHGWKHNLLDRSNKTRRAFSRVHTSAKVADVTNQQCQSTEGIRQYLDATTSILPLYMLFIVPNLVIFMSSDMGVQRTMGTKFTAPLRSRKTDAQNWIDLSQAHSQSTPRLLPKSAHNFKSNQIKFSFK